jgi:CRP-like cAMP-binding protein
MEVGDLLKRTVLFEDLTESDIERLAQSTRIQSYRAGQVIIREGRIGAAFFVIVSGSVEVVKDINSSEPVAIATLGAGEFFGEIATMKHEIRSASVRAKEDTKCLVIWQVDFSSYVSRHPEVAAKLEAVYSARFGDDPD